jgi:hypothetical protein
MWNKLVKVIKNDKVNMNDKDYATLLLGQLNTAGGKELLKNEVERFLIGIEEKYGLIIK